MLLKFDKDIISKEEIMKNIEYYKNKANEGFELYSKGNKAEAMKILREIRENLKLECNYYKKASVDKYIMCSNIYTQYKSGISDALYKQYNVNSYEELSSNLYDVLDYMNYTEMIITQLEER